MSRLLAHCMIPVGSRKPSAPFHLQLDKEIGNLPLLVHSHGVYGWSRSPSYYEADLPYALRLEKEGKQRIRLYCSERPANAVRLLVDGGSMGQLLGRRQQRVVETLTWVQSQSCYLRYHYDQPQVTIREATPFYDRNGKEVPPPLYRAEQALFQHSKVVTGALLVEYQPAYFLYEIPYGTGEELLTEKAFREIKLAWLMCDTKNAALPEVRVIALSGTQATLLSFKRDYWPPSSTAPAQFVPAERLSPNGEHIVYLETGRETSMERIYSSQNPNNYVDVRKTHSVSFAPQNGNQGGGRGAQRQAGSMVMRFSNPQSSS
ncbi:hypothetical protein [Candidatus Magnetaquicoccus inordinatus]|uniref:hypothetical protein n=1 Tax=Candidatus Magnetaquicoccus inordinatus TaxID=2496818 RepID=UPI00102BA6DF|nr:hypothetical protein [Candidatus Magnetaquicoccus inordinatus]